MKRMKHLGASVALGAVVMFAAFSSTGSALATPTARPKLSCFSGTLATCTYDGTTGTATLDTRTGCPIVNGVITCDPQAYAGVSVLKRGLAGTLVGRLSFSFSYLCLDTSDPTTCAAGGSPRWGFSIDTNGDGARDGYAFISANTCSSPGTVDNSCPVEYSAFVPADGGSYLNWAAFVAAHPTATITKNIPFIVADYRFYGQIFGVSITVA